MRKKDKIAAALFFAATAAIITKKRFCKTTHTYYFPIIRLNKAAYFRELLKLCSSMYLSILV